MEVAEIETTAQSMDSSVQYHLINDVIGFLLYMHQQIPSSVIMPLLSFRLLTLHLLLMNPLR